MRNNLKSFHFKLWPYFVALAIVITIVMMSFYFSAFDSIRNSIYNDDTQNAEKTAAQISTIISDLDTLAELVKQQPLVVNTFLELSNQIDMTNYFDKNVLLSIDLSSTLKKLIVNNRDNISIIIYNDNGDFISSQEYNIDKENLANNLRSVNYHLTLAQIEQAGGRILRYSNLNKWTNSGNSVITVYKPLMNNYSGEICGLIEVSRNATLVESCIDIISKPDTNVHLRSRINNHLLYPDSYTPLENSKFRATYPVGDGEWEVVIEQADPISFYHQIQLFVVLLFIYIILISFMIYIAHFFEARINRPIIHFTNYVKNLTDTERISHVIENDAIDEIQTLSKSFDDMLVRLDESLNREKKAYSMALQAQMNPHFLYNTLAVIGSEGAEGGCDTVADMCAELSDMLRYVTSYEKSSVTVKEEIEHTTNYLQLMKCRYEDYFSYNITVSPELFNMSIPKLFIQPLAENCFKHGFKKKTPPWHIDISLEGNIESWQLSVADNGVGISKESIETITNSIQKADKGQYPDGFGGLGIVATIIRARTLFYKNTGYTIENLDGNGTRITIFSHKKEHKNV